MIIAAMFAVAYVEWPLTPPSIPAHWTLGGSIDRFGGKFQGLLLLPLSAALVWGLIAAVALGRQRKFDAPVRRALLLLGYALLVIFIAVFGDQVLWINGVALNINYFLLPATLLMCAALGNLLLRVPGRRHGAMPG
jgi:hypothetical protein